MSDQQLETAPAAVPGATPPDQAATSAPAPAPASTPPVDVDKLKREAKAEAFREFQAKADRQRARELKAQQQAEKARAQLKQAGVADAATVDDAVVWRQKAAEYDELQAEREAEQAALQQAAEIAGLYKVDPNDYRLQGLPTWDEFHRVARALAQANVDAELAAARKAAEEAARKKVDAEIAAGQHDVLGGAPPAAPGGQDALMKEYRKEVAPLRGDTMRIMALKKKYRAKGLDV